MKWQMTTARMTKKGDDEDPLLVSVPRFRGEAPHDATRLHDVLKSMREQNGKIPVASNVGSYFFLAPEDRVSRELVPASDAVAVAAHNFAHNQVEQVRRAPHKAHDSTVLT